MNIFSYDKNTKEYVGFQKADANPGETKLQGKFIPLIPAYSTIIEPPKYKENQIPVFENGVWIVKSDYRKNYYKVDQDFNVSKITDIGEPEGFYIVDGTIGKAIIENPNKFKIVNGEIIKKTENEYALEQAQERECVFNSQFFEIEGVGYYRKEPKGYTSAVESINTAFNTVTVLGSLPANVLTFYSKPDFTVTEQCSEEWLVANQFKNEAMTSAEFGAFYAKFIEAWNKQEHL